MIRLDLTEEECAALRDLLESAVSDMRMEIADTDGMEFREGLKRKKAHLERVRQALAAAA